MSALQELLAIDHQQVLEFFVRHLRDVSEPTINPEELLYNASVLAHYAEVSTHPDVDRPAPTTLGAVFDQVVSDTAPPDDGRMIEAVGAQCLLLAGFFEAQMRGRYNIRWYARLGAGCFRRAALHERSPHKARLLDAIAMHFEPWRRRHAQLSRELREQAIVFSRYSGGRVG